MNSNYKNLLKDPHYLKIVVANTISDFGSSIDNIAFSWLVYKLTGSPTWIAIIFGAASIPMIFLQPVFGVLVERCEKKKIILISDFLGIILMSIMGILYLTESLTPVMLLLFTLFNATIESLRMPAGFALVPKILSKENFSVGKALSASASQTASLIGLACAGFIIGIWGIQTALFIDAITFALSFIIIYFIKYKEKLEYSENNDKLNLHKFKREFKEGFAYFRNKKVVFYICLYAVVLNFFLVPMNTYLPLYIGDSLGLSAEIYSLVSATFTIGIIIGSIVSPKVSAKVGLLKIFLLEGVCISLHYIALFYLQYLDSKSLTTILLMISLFLLGNAIGIGQVSLSVAFISNVEENYMARVGSIFNSSATATIPIASLLLSFFSLFIGIEILFILSSLGLAIITFLFYSNKDFRNL